MADGLTTLHDLVQPEVGSSYNSWGTKLNNDLESIDGLLSRLKLQPAAISVAANVLTLDLADGNVFEATNSDDFTFAFDNADLDFGHTIYLVLHNAGAFPITAPAELTMVGGDNPLANLPASGDALFLFTTPDGGVSWYGAILRSTPEDGSIVASMLGVGAVTTGAVLNDAITQDKIADDAVGTDQILDAAVTEPKLDPAIPLVALRGTHLTLSADVTATGAEQTLSWPAANEEFDNGGFHSDGSPTLITIPSGLTGLYLVTVHLVYNITLNTASTLKTRLYKQASTLLAEAISLLPGSVSGNFQVATVTRLVKLTAGDSLSARFLATCSGGGCSVSVEADKSYFEIALIAKGS